jgi:hypothetical protein
VLEPGSGNDRRKFESSILTVKQYWSPRFSRESTFAEDDSFCGIGAVSDKLLQRRAQDLAEEDGRTEPRDADRAEALKELSGLTEDPPPEVPPGDENLTTWNESPDLTGHAAPTFSPDDETDIAEELTEEGVEEADVDRRRAAKDKYRSDAS